MNWNIHHGKLRKQQGVEDSENGIRWDDHINYWENIPGLKQKEENGWMERGQACPGDSSFLIGAETVLMLFLHSVHHPLMCKGSQFQWALLTKFPVNTISDYTCILDLLMSLDNSGPWSCSKNQSVYSFFSPLNTASLHIQYASVYEVEAVVSWWYTLW